MRRPIPLRLRFGLLAMLLGLALSSLASLELLAAAEEYESIISTELLRGQAEDYARLLAGGTPSALPRTQRLRGYRIDDPALPQAYAALPPGLSEDPDNENSHIGVFDTRAGRLVFIIDLGDIEARERHQNRLMVLVTALGTALSGWLGWLLAGVAVKPVRKLAEGVEALPVQPRPTHLADQVSHDALGRLARAIDGYQARLVDADANEQAFLADASHELRTPLAVIQGAVEVLQDDVNATPAQRKRLARVERGVVEMRRLLEAMLAAARRKPLQAESVDVATLMRDAAEAASDGHGDDVTVIAGTYSLHTEPREAILLLAGLIRRLRHTRSGPLQMEQLDDQITLRIIEPEPSGPALVNARADTCTGTALLDRLAARLGWRVAFVSATQVVIMTGAEPSNQ